MRIIVGRVEPINHITSDQLIVQQQRIVPNAGSLHLFGSIQ